MPKKITKSFTIFELLLVITLISVLYYLLFANFSISTKNEEITLQTIKKYLLQYYDGSKVELICFKDNLDCIIKKNDKILKHVHLLKSDDIRVYKVYGYNTYEYNFPKYYYYDRFKDVILKYSINPNLSSSHYIVEYQDRFYYFDSYFHQEAKIFNDLTAATEEWLKNYEELKG